MWAVWTLAVLSSGLCLSQLLTSATWAHDTGHVLRPSPFLPAQGSLTQATTAGWRRRPAARVSGIAGKRWLGDRAPVSSSTARSGLAKTAEFDARGYRGWKGENSGSPRVRQDGRQSSTGRAKRGLKRHSRGILFPQDDPSLEEPLPTPPVTQRSVTTSCYAFMMPSTIRQPSCDGGVWSCAGRCGQFRQHPCSCHVNCRVYRTCCHDFHDVCSDEMQIPSAEVIAAAGTDSSLFQGLQFPGVSSDGSSDARSSMSAQFDSSPSPFPDPLSLPTDVSLDFPNSSASFTPFPNVPVFSLPNDVLTSPQTPTIPHGSSNWSATCQSFSSALLVSQCPYVPLDGSSYVEIVMFFSCLQKHERTISHLMPVTDPVTGIHFANMYCYYCWVLQAKNKGSVPLDVSELSPPLFWHGEFLLHPEDRPMDEHTQTDVFSHFKDISHNVKLHSPEGFPHHRCHADVLDGMKRDVCPVCPLDTSQVEVTRLCTGEAVYVQSETGPYIYNNKYCLYCHTAHDVYTSLVGSGQTDKENVTKAILDSIMQLKCEEPDDIGFPELQPPSDDDVIVTVQWDSSTAAWVFNNTGSLADSRDTSRLNWTRLQCRGVACTALSCNPYSVLRAGRCVRDLAPYTSVLYLCVTATPDTPDCITELGHMNTSTAVTDQLMVRLEKVVVEALLELAPWRFDAGQEHTHVSTHVSAAHGLVFTVTSETSVTSPGDVPPPPEPEEVEQAAARVAREAERLALGSWARVCLQGQLYRAERPVPPAGPCASPASLLPVRLQPSSRAWRPAAGLPPRMAGPLLLSCLLLLVCWALWWC